LATGDLSSESGCALEDGSNTSVALLTERDANVGTTRARIVGIGADGAPNSLAIEIASYPWSTGGGKTGTEKSYSTVYDSRVTCTGDRFLAVGSVNGAQGYDGIDFYAQLFQAGGQPLLPAWKVNPKPVVTAYEPRLAVDAEGTVMFIWTTDPKDQHA